MRRRNAIFLLPAIAVVALAFWFTRSREPRYHGHKLGYWVKDLQNTNWVEALQAARTIGSNAIPFLLEDLQAQDSEWKLKFNDWLYRTFDWKSQYTTAENRHEIALGGFFFLGAKGESAIAKLTSLMEDKDDSIRRAAMSALGWIGTETAARLLIQALTNQNTAIRGDAAFTLRLLGGKASNAIPALLLCLDDKEPYVSERAASALGQFGFRPDTIVPALIRKLDDPDRRVQSAAFWALSSFGTNALSALSVLQQLSDQSPEPRRHARIASALVRIQCVIHEGAIVRGPRREKKIALVFTGHEFAEGAETILNNLTNHHARASFFLTGTFLDNPKLKTLVERIVREGHYLGPHSDKHLLYCAWDASTKTLLTRPEFHADLMNNAQKVDSFVQDQPRYFLPPYEHHNIEIANWTRNLFRTLINYTPGTRSNADYTSEADKNFVSSQKIFDSIVKHEQEDPNGLNGFILLLHIGVGPNRADKFHNRFAELLDYLAAKGYQFVRVDELLEPKDEGIPNPNRNRNPNRGAYPTPNGTFQRR